MALDTDALIVAGTGSILIGTAGTAVEPTLTQLEAFANSGTLPGSGAGAWEVLGAISRDDLPAPGRDGGDTTSLFIWNTADPVRTTKATQTDYWDVTAVQWDGSIASLYYGGGDNTAPNRYAGPTSSGPTVKSAVILLNDGGNIAAQWNSRMEIIGTDEIELDAEDFTAVPLRFTRLAPVAGQKPFSWIGRKFGTPATP